MGFPKHLLRISMDSDNQSLLHYISRVHRDLSQDPVFAKHFSRPITVSVRDETQRNQLQDYMAGNDILKNATLVVDTEVNVGPSAGLLSAHRHDPEAHWIVTGCDYPRLTSAALHQLVYQHITRSPAITCFVNASGINEPLLAVWSPNSLAALRELLLQNPRAGPSTVIRDLTQQSREEDCKGSDCRSGVKKVIPEHGEWIVDVNTTQDWQKVQRG
jgi:molybdopterin-guanine dinucleotide biosynthesis protein A